MKEQLVTNDIKTFIVDGDKYRTRLSKKYLQRKPYQPNDPKKVIAFIPGTIKKVLVNEGDTVNKGDNLLVLEAMKMNNSILASAQGVIAKVLVKTGQVVSKNQLLIELE
ncbi:MAG: acetyl-CoA carboxylase biotin carboxyl carrier protein subunit [Bacteroidales bacterium]|jgi:biotin carboxyl carrier protein|nr:acetyl-CoA carboxylase biotin carboxyl carrier protein subunit [Bacteroidales bacterium]